MNVFFAILMHVFLVGAMIAFAIALVYYAFLTERTSERLLRFLAIFVGAMIVVGAQATGTSFSAFAALALASSRASTAGAGFFTYFLPALVGVGFGYFLMYLYRKHDDLAMRIICLVGSLALAAFISAYAVDLGVTGVFFTSAAVPNITFAAGVGLALVLSIPSKKQGQSLIDWLRARFNSALNSSAPSDTAPVSDDRKPRDPFDF